MEKLLSRCNDFPHERDSHNEQSMVGFRKFSFVSLHKVRGEGVYILRINVGDARKLVSDRSFEGSPLADLKVNVNGR